MNVAGQLAGKRVVILGMARQGVALARYCVGAGASVTLSDLSPAEKLATEVAAAEALGITLVLGGHPMSLLDQCDLLCLSGGVAPQIPLAREAIRRGIPLSNDSLLTMQIARSRGLGPIVAITGSSGKTTTTTLAGLMLEQSGVTAHVGGNIGTPLIDRMERVRPGEPIVLELSSFQLELFDPALAWGDLDGVGPDVAAILNITPNHLDRHPSMAAYAGAKLNLLRHLPAQTTLCLGVDDGVTGQLVPLHVAGNHPPAPPEEWALAPLLEEMHEALTEKNIRWEPFSRTQVLARGAWMEEESLVYNRKIVCHRNEVRLRGEHNLSNLLAALAIGGAAGASLEAITQVARSFEGVRHRLEIVQEVGGVTWINDSIATSPERAIAGLRSFDPAESTIILLAGGKDKNLPWQAFADEVLERVSFLIGFGHAGAMIVETVRNRAESMGKRMPGSAVVHRLDEGVELAARSANPGTVVLLSPGGTSYDAYRDFEARGQHFCELVEQYKELCLRREA